MFSTFFTGLQLSPHTSIFTLNVKVILSGLEYNPKIKNTITDWGVAQPTNFPDFPDFSWFAPIYLQLAQICINLPPICFNLHQLLLTCTFFYWLSTDSYWLSNDSLLTLNWLFTDSLLTLYWLSTDSPMTHYWLSTDSLLECFGSAVSEQ